MKMSDIFPGLKNIVQEVGAELHRLGVQGAAEIPHALFTGNPYTPYGRGQSAPSDHDQPTPEVTNPDIAHNQQEQERGGMER